MGGVLTIEPHGRSHIYTLQPKQQILIHYNSNLAFAEDGKFCNKSAETTRALTDLLENDMAALTEGMEMVPFGV